MRIRYLVATAAFGLSTAANAQSTGSVDFEESVIVISGSSLRNGVGGILVTDTSKVKQMLMEDQQARANRGQAVLDGINVIPEVTSPTRLYMSATSKPVTL